MKQYAITFMEDVATANGRNSDPTDFIAEAKLRGKVEDFNEAVNGIRAEYQKTIDNLTIQLNAIKAQELTPDEIVLLNTYRDCKSATGETYQKRIDSLEQCLEDVRISSKKRAEQIAQLVAEIAEANA
jgi:hypothetical protein